MSVVRKISKEDWRRLTKICGMFGSSFDGERASAAKLATDIIKSYGLTWEQVFASFLGPQPIDDIDHVVAAAECLKMPECHSEWELQFLRGIMKRRDLSDKQWDVLERLLTKTRAMA